MTPSAYFDGLGKLPTDEKIMKLHLLKEQVQGCQLCPLSQTRTNVVFGEGSLSARVMVIGEAPGKDEDEQGVPFVGRSGQLLRKLLRESFDDLSSEIFITNLIKCRPPNNRNPEPNEIDCCSSYLAEQVAVISPVVVLAVGAFAARALLKTRLGIGELRAKVYHDGQRVVVPTYHPAAALRGGPMVATKMRADISLLKLYLEGEVSTCPFP